MSHWHEILKNKCFFDTVPCTQGLFCSSDSSFGLDFSGCFFVETIFEVSPATNLLLNDIFMVQVKCVVVGKMGLAAVKWRKRILVAVVIICGILIMKEIVQLSVSSDQVIQCDQPSSVKMEMEEVLIRTFSAINTLHLSSQFLCFDSLWAAHTANKPFSWKSVNEICILNEEISKIEEATMIRVFKREGVVLSYSSSTGEYDVRLHPNSQIRLKIFLFERDQESDQMKRVGWKHRLLPPDSCSVTQCFPSHLVEKPLPTTKFSGIRIPIPKEEIEIQKYHYPDDWWKSDRSPPECRTHV